MGRTRPKSTRRNPLACRPLHCVLALSALLAAAAPAPGAEGSNAGDRAYRLCMTRSEQSNMAWEACGDALIRRKEALLRRALRRALGSRGAAARRALQLEQRAWTGRYDGACEEYQTDYGREGQVLDYPLCRAAFVEERIRGLQRSGAPVRSGDARRH
jgi:uncharacterized protein YecT (DUF1311 family)